ncbi:uncharacterized protein RAG0_15335 [Rhynchosporium agropyri]|uniref:BTB domain-containing protein n=1 Tax=Rhynchosporium agropyri TaxID=914238 RepID=A0A1E1LKM6_9HELO|nr:uncharacterized protein RAG0_15335 [Rhynchosporium agropyri]
MTSMTSVSADVAKSHQTSKYHQARKRRKTILPTYSDPKSLVTFLIGPGPNPVEFLIHKEIVCHNSRVLAIAFNGKFIEGRTQTYGIDDTTERAFKLFMQWLYSKSFGPGDKTTELIVHKEVAYHQSKVLNAAFNSSFIEGSAQTYRIENFREVTFTFMVQWLYSQRFNLSHHDPAFDCKISMDKDISSALGAGRSTCNAKAAKCCD